ncbi:MAG: MarR family winged helix-turn-helix transcriptional regulator [Janthinobacterium lividum]
MATPHACAELVDVLPGLLRARRLLVGTLNTPTLATLAIVHERGSMRASEVADHFGLDISTVSRQVTHLRQKGFLEGNPDPEDGRSHRLTVTEAGIEKLHNFRHHLVDKLVARLTDWPDEEVGELARLLDKLGHTGVATTPPESPATPPTPTKSLQEKELQALA